MTQHDEPQYTWPEIERDWLDGGVLQASPDDIASAFNEVASRFGREWIEATRTKDGATSSGTSPTLYIVTLARLLRVLDGVPNSAKLIEKVRRGEADTRAELIGIFLLSSGGPEVLIEVEPEARVGMHDRKPDCRARVAAEPWTYVEVTNPGTSDAQADVHRGLERLTELVNDCSGSFALEVFLKRDPTAGELDLIADEIRQSHQATVQSTMELPSGLGTLYWNPQLPGVVVLDDHGDTYTPRLGSTGVAMGGGHHRHIVVRWPYTDTRAETFIRHEARQLPTDAPGLIMIYTSGNVGAMKAWSGLIERRLQPSLHTRVSAVCLFSSGQVPAEDGEDWRIECKLILNPYANFALPSWIAEQFRQFPSDEEGMSNRTR